MKVKTETNRYRIRIGDYRVLYSIDDNEQEIIIHRIVHRSEAYKG